MPVDDYLFNWSQQIFLYRLCAKYSWGLFCSQNLLVEAVDLKWNYTEENMMAIELDMKVYILQILLKLQTTILQLSSFLLFFINNPSGDEMPAIHSLQGEGSPLF